MARCPVCNQKIPGTQSHCGKGKCIAKVEEYIPNCINCGGLAMAGEICPHNRGYHQPPENLDLVDSTKRNKKAKGVV